MRKVLYALTPVSLYSIYLYGWRPAFIIASCLFFGAITEYCFMKKSGKKTSEAVLVTSLLLALAMPPGIPLWIPPIGVVFAVLLGKCVYGGFGRNIFNPAMTGRAFLYLAFPGIMTSAWMIPGGFGVDGLTGATRLIDLRKGMDVFPFSTNELSWLFGLRSGSIGESAAFLIIPAAIYLIATKTASWRLITSTVGSFVILNTVLYLLEIYGYSSFSTVVHPVEGLFSGALLFTAVFMATDPVTAPKKIPAQWIYGIIIGLTIGTVRFFSASFPEGAAFGVLTGNMFAALFDTFFAPKKKKP